MAQPLPRPFADVLALPGFEGDWGSGSRCEWTGMMRELMFERSKRLRDYSRPTSRRAFEALLTLVAAAIIGASNGRAQAAGAYDIDPKASRVEIHVFRAGAFSGLGDNHTIELKKFSGTASRSGEEPWQVHVTGESASLTVLDPNLSDSAREEVQKTMVGPSQLDVAKFPSIEIKSRSVKSGDAAGALLLVADLTLHGVTRSAEFPIAWSEADRGLRVHGKAKLLLRDFGIEPIRKFLGTIQVRNDFEVVYDLRLVRRD